MITKEQIAGMKTPELITLYNRLTGKSIKKFSSRKAGEKQVLAVSNKAGATVKTVKGANGARTGRPSIDFTVQLTEGSAKSKPHAKSDRMALIEWLRGRKEQEHKASVSSIEKHFSKNMRGVIQKLLEKNWLKRLKDSAA